MHFHASGSTRHCLQLVHQEHRKNLLTKPLDINHPQLHTSNMSAEVTCKITIAQIVTTAAVFQGFQVTTNSPSSERVHEARFTVKHRKYYVCLNPQLRAKQSEWQAPRSANSGRAAQEISKTLISHIRNFDFPESLPKNHHRLGDLPTRSFSLSTLRDAHTVRLLHHLIDW